MKLALSVAFALLATRTVRAGDENPETHAKSPAKAALLSVGGTAAPIAFGLASAHTGSITLGVAAVGSTLVGPSLGHWYAGKYFTIGMGMRLAGAAALAGGAIDELGCEDAAGEACQRQFAGPLIATGIALLAIGTITDIASAPRAAARWNDEHGFSVSPLVLSSGNTKPDTIGLTVSGAW